MPSTRSKRLLCLWLPNWPIQRLRSGIAAGAPDELPSAARATSGAPLPSGAVADQRVHSNPLVLWGVDPRRGRLVVACCASAAALGIHPGMTVGEADSLARRGPATAAQASLPPLFLPHDGEADLEALRALAEVCAEHLSPIVAIEPLDDFLWAGQTLHQPQSLAMDVTGVGVLFGGEDRLIAAATSLLRRHRLGGRLAIADTTGAAWAVAHYGEPVAGDGEPESQRGKKAYADGSETVEALVVPPGQTRSVLGRLPIASLRIRPETSSMLRRLGIDSIDSLLRLPRGGLATRLGSALLQRLDQAMGEVDEPLPAHHAAAEDRASTDLEYPTSDREILGHQLELLVRQVAAGLSARQRGALRMVCRFDLEKPLGSAEHQQLGCEAVQQNLEIRVGLFTPSATAEYLLRLLSGVLEQHRFSSPAHRVVVAATMTGPLATRQPTLAGMGNGEEGSVADLAKLVDGLSSRLGRGRVLGIDVTDDPLPEQAVRLRPLAGQPSGSLVPGRPLRRGKPGRRRAERSPAANPPRSADSLPLQTTPDPSRHRTAATPWDPPAPSDPLRRPLAMLAHPVPLAVSSSRQEIAASGQERADGPPRRFRHGGRIHRVVRYWGPERLETGWWSGPMHRRDYYRIETEEGLWMWIYRNLRDGQWWLHGYFS